MVRTGCIAVDRYSMKVTGISMLMAFVIMEN